jgi:hypothetical protein
MNDDFLALLREPPRREFASALYEKISREEAPVKPPLFLLAAKRFAFGLALFCLAMAILLILSPDARARVAAALDMTPLDFGSQALESTTLHDAQSQLPFHILEPAILPPSYSFAYALVPRHNPRSATLVYTNPTRPTSDLTIWQGISTDRTDCTKSLGQVLREAVTINDHPAFYIPRPEAEGPDGSKRPDDNANMLILEYSDRCVWLVGQRVAGVDREALIRIAASMH